MKCKLCFPHDVLGGIIMKKSGLNLRCTRLFLSPHSHTCVDPLLNNETISKMPKYAKEVLAPLSVAFQKRNSARHPVGFLTMTNKTAPLLMQKGDISFFFPLRLSFVINSNKVSGTEAVSKGQNSKYFSRTAAQLLF